MVACTCFSEEKHTSMSGDGRDDKGLNPKGTLWHSKQDRLYHKGDRKHIKEVAVRHHMGRFAF